jgi:hypothetical protein
MMLNIKNRREFFWDDTMTDSSKTNAGLKLHEPVKREIVLVHDAPWEGDGCDYHNFIYDNGKYRLYYLGWQMISSDKTSHTDTGIRVCYAESTDGLHWIKPSLGLRMYNGSSDNNIILDITDNRFDNFMVLHDLNPACPDSERYKGIGSGEGGLWCWTSADAINFKKAWLMTNKGAFDSLNTVTWDGIQKKYIGYIRGFHDKEGTDANWVGIRDIRYIESCDFKNWSEPIQLDFDGGEDYPLYTNCVSKYYRGEHVLTGFPTRYVERSGWNDSFEKLCGKDERLMRMNLHPRYGLTVTDCVFMTSRDGKKWKRYDEAFIRPGPEQPRNWVYGDGYPTLGMFETPGQETGSDNEISMFVMANHWMGIPAVLYRYSLRIDGFVSYNAAYKPQRVVTKQFIYEGDKLYLNFRTSARGSVYIRIIGEDGSALNSCEIFGDKVDRHIGFENGSPAVFKGKPVTMEFIMSDADIYSFVFI